jgi:hypothetical protein
VRYGLRYRAARPKLAPERRLTRAVMMLDGALGPWHDFIIMRRFAPPDRPLLPRRGRRAATLPVVEVCALVRLPPRALP